MVGCFIGPADLALSSDAGFLAKAAREEFEAIDLAGGASKGSGGREAGTYQ